MALVNPNIAMSYRGVEVPQQNMLADYAAIQQIQGGQQAQQLNALKMQEAQAAMQERNALRQLNPTAADYEAQLFKVSPTLGIQYRKEAATTAAQQAATKLSEAKTAETSLDTSRKKLKYAWESVGDASTPELAIQKIADGIKDGVFKPQDGAAEIQQLQNMTPEAFRQYRIDKISQILDAKDKFGAMLPKIARQDAGGQIIPIQDNPALPGYGLPVAGMAPIAKTETFADKNAAIRVKQEGQRIGLEGRRVAVLEQDAKQKQDPVFQQAMAGAKATGEAIAKGTVAAQQALPGVITNAMIAVNAVDDMVGRQEVKDASGKVIQPATAPHKGFQDAVGATWKPGFRFIPGTDASDFQSYQDQIEGAAFLSAFEALKGGGAISEKEGAKATAAKLRMKLAQSEVEYVKAAREFQEVVRTGVENARRKFGAGGAAPAAGGANIDALLDKYK
jgi:hypothetical protein